MKLAKTIACGAAAFGLAAGGALAGEGHSGMNDDGSSSEPAMAQEETYILLEPVDVTYVYEVDEDRDGVTDSYLFLEEPDTLAMSESDYWQSESFASEDIGSEPSAGG